MPDRTFVPGSTKPESNIPSVDLPVNVGVIKCGSELILYDTGWKQQDYLKMTGSDHWAPLADQLKALGFNAADVTKVVIGHAHWDHAGQLSDLPNAVLYVQREELKAIEWALNYPEPHIRAINSDPGSCNRTPACGYMPLTMEEVYGKVLKGKAVIVDGEAEILPGVRIHPAFRAHTAGSQLLEVPTSIGKLVFGSDAFSSYEGIRDWMTANVQQTDTVQQFLACVVFLLAGSASAHDASSYGGVFRSRDLGAAWLNADVGLFLNAALVVAVDPRDSSHLLVGTDLGILSSHNGGRSWVPEARDLIIGAVFALAFSPDGELAVCAAASGVFRRDRDGWLRAEAPESAIPARALVVGPATGRFYLLGRSRLFSSEDGSRSYVVV